MTNAESTPQNVFMRKSVVRYVPSTRTLIHREGRRASHPPQNRAPLLRASRGGSYELFYTPTGRALTKALPPHTLRVLDACVTNVFPGWRPVNHSAKCKNPMW